MLDRTPVSELFKNQWRGILPAFGLDPKLLNHKHGPCPFCGGKDRFMFTDFLGRGDWICHQCGDGTGIEFVARATGLGYRDAIKRVEEIAASAPRLKPRRERSDEDKRRALNSLWDSSSAVIPGGPVARYLTARVGQLAAFPTHLRASASLPYWDDGAETKHPAMLAKVSGPDGRPVNVHRTYLTDDGRKANVPSPRKMAAGALPKGSAIRLAPTGERLGIAEGIETALAASQLFGVPCWAAVNSVLLASWFPPPTVRQVFIFGDNDSNYTGQASAFALAHRMACNDKHPIKVVVKIPDSPGADWADVLNKELNIPP